MYLISACHIPILKTLSTGDIDQPDLHCKSDRVEVDHTTMRITEHSHSATAIKKRLQRPKTQSYLRDWIYGGIDGAVTTFAVVSGVVGGKLAYIVIIILGIANLVADGFSMSAGNYLGTRSEHEEYERYRQVEEEHIARYPAGETQEIRQILTNEGYKGKDLERMVTLITSNKTHWINTMLREEYSLPRTIRSPIKAAAMTFCAFIICGAVPLLSYLISLPHPFTWSIVLTCIVFFLIGSVKSRWTLQRWWYSGAITLLIGAVAAALAYFIGYGLHTFLLAT